MEHIGPKGDFLAGRPVPLFIPSSVRREWLMNGVDDASLAELEAEFGHCHGYEFEWGQIIETLAGPDDDGQTPVSAGAVVCWHFALVNLHHAFLDAGGNLGELSDLAVDMLEQIRQDALMELTPEERGNALPDSIEFGEGNTISAFEVTVSRSEDAEQARHWIGSFFIPGVLPLLILRLHADNCTTSSSANVH